ncbi:MAG: BON domain-containing protein [Gammaproteobacteria bacterium]|nr:BON domain-containing protein [Gammaproteobacteria bacterium]
MKIPHFESLLRSSNVFWLMVLMIIMLLISSTAISATDISDSKISDQINNELILDPAIFFNTIDVNTTEGIVTLSGNVNNILAKNRATRIAETVRGVRSVINTIEVDPLIDKSSGDLKKDVNNALIYDAATNGYEIAVTADDEGRIILTGTVDSWAERELSEKVAGSVSGVTAVTNNINIKPKSERADSEIKDEIEKRLHWDTLVDDSLINVNVTNGKVYLSGAVGSAAEKRHAAINAWISGVTVVDDSELEVKIWARDDSLRKDKYVQRPDEEVQEAVKDAFIYDPRIYAFNLDVTVSNGIVTLRGVVDNIQAKKAAIRDARHTVGVASVNSLIKVRPLAKFSDEEIAEQIREALLRNPYIESHEIEVHVRNKIVYLEGVVDTYFEKGIAENVAFRSSGVSDVRNSLTVAFPDVTTYDPYIYDWSVYDTPWYIGGFMTGKNDSELKSAIENQLFWSPFIDSDDVNISVEGGIATLTGKVDSLREYETAEENAFEGGAIGVLNRIDIINE